MNKTIHPFSVNHHYVLFRVTGGVCRIWMLEVKEVQTSVRHHTITVLHELILGNMMDVAQKSSRTPGTIITLTQQIFGTLPPQGHLDRLYVATQRGKEKLKIASHCIWAVGHELVISITYILFYFQWGQGLKMFGCALSTTDNINLLMRTRRSHFRIIGY